MVNTKNECESTSHASTNSTSSQGYLQPVQPVKQVYMTSGWQGQTYYGAVQGPPTGVPGPHQVIQHQQHQQHQIHPVQGPGQPGQPVQIQGQPGQPVQMQQPGQPIQMQGQPIQMQGQPIQMQGQPIQMQGQPVQMQGQPVQMLGQPVQIPGQTPEQGIIAPPHGPAAPYDQGIGPQGATGPPPVNQYYQYYRQSAIPQTGGPAPAIQPINHPMHNQFTYQSLPSINQQPGIQEHTPAPTQIDDRQKNGYQRTKSSIPRKRALTACDSCRMKKTKCDNVRPKCGSCTRNGVHACQYRSDEHPTETEQTANSNIVIRKLDQILKEVEHFKELNGPEAKEDSSKRQKLQNNRQFSFDKCFWDMSLNTIMKWDYLKSSLNISQTEVSTFSQSLKKHYNEINVIPIKHESWSSRLSFFNYLEKVLNKNFPQIMNSFFLNCHTKIPMLDMLSFVACLEMYTILKDNDDSFSMIKLLEAFSSRQADRKEKAEKNGYTSDHAENDDVPDFYLEALKAANIDDTVTTRKTFKTLCKIIPILVLMCALGVLTSAVQLDNLSKFSTSLEERKSLVLGGLSDPEAFSGLEEEFSRNRDELSYGLVKYANFLTTIYPQTLKQSSMRTVLFHVLSSQYYLNVMSPLKAYKEITCASQNMMYYLEMKKNNEETTTYDENLYSIRPDKRDDVERIFWTCLKLESELRIELSPYVPVSGISQIIPPCNFPRIPEQVSIERSDYSEACLRLANKYYDEYSWHYFLTEIAVRKVENKMFDEIYSHQCSIDKLWDQPEFVNESTWTIFIKYLNQYNGIINSLSPKIRTFILQEINTDQIYRRIKKKDEKKQQNLSSELDIYDNLDDFLVDDDLLIQAQSESIMYIKTRILSSKLLLFRPLVYLILEGKVSFLELVEASMSVIKNSAMTSTKSSFTSLESPESSASTSSYLFSEIKNQQNYNLGMDYFDLINAPMLYQKQYPDEDFSSFIEYNWDTEDREGMDEQYVHGFKIKNLQLARARILRVFIQHLISIPKLNIPKLGSHRHPGSWYYLRSLFIGNLYQFMLYKKIQELVRDALNDRDFQAFIRLQPEISSPMEILALVDMIISKESIQTMFEHSIVMFGYWKDEIKDCGLYMEILEKCLAVI